MSVLVYIENVAGTFKKSAFEAVSYARAIGEMTGQEVRALSIGPVATADLQKVGAYGVSKVIEVKHERLAGFVSQAYASVIANVAKNLGATAIVLANTFSGKELAPRVAAKLNAALASGALSLPVVNGDAWEVRRSVFSGKAIATEVLKAAVKVIALAPNAVEAQESPVAAAVESYDPQVRQEDLSVAVRETVRTAGKVSLPEADIVVSAGRGMKGPENWAMVEELAEVLGAATACSKPVSDAGWRPHAEHVGQTGLAVSPKLYIAIGISGAIQHLAGVSSSKTIVVINSDPEAPFFKVADYGIVGDAFEVVPKLIAAFRAKG